MSISKMPICNSSFFRLACISALYSVGADDPVRPVSVITAYLPFPIEADGGTTSSLCYA